MDEKTMKRQVMIMLTTAFVIFTALFMTLGSYLVLKLYDEGKEREYTIIGKCFNHVIANEVYQVISITKHTSRDVAETLERNGDLSELAENIKNLFNVSEIYVVGKFGKVIYPKSAPSYVFAYVNRVKREGKGLVDLITPGREIFIISAMPSKGDIVVTVTKSVSNMLESARASLGGVFEIVAWDSLPDEVLRVFEQNGKDYTIIRKGDYTQVYYNIKTPFKTKGYFIYWKEPSGSKDVIIRVVVMVLAFSIPMFIVVLTMINLLRRKIFTNFVEPLEKMIETLDDIVSMTSSSSQELAASSQELAANTKNLEEKGAKLSDLTSEMLDDLEKTKDFADSVAEFATFLKRSMENLEDASKSLSEAMKTISKMGGLIQQIGERIVVLSINASIEGSREQIDREAIKALAQEIAELSETTSERVSEIFSSIQESQDRLADMEGAIKNITLETEKLQASSKKLSDMIKSNRGKFEGITDTVQSMFESIEEINFATQNLAEAATELSQKAYDAQKVVDEFMMREKKEEKEEGGGEDV